MKYILLLFWGGLMIGAQYGCAEWPEKKWIPGIPKIIIHCSLPANYKQLFPNTEHRDVKDITVLFWTPISDIGLQPKWNSLDANQLGTVMRWSFQSEKPVFITTAFQRSGVLICPGDSVHIDFTPNGITYSGKGAVALQLQYDLEQAQNKVEKPVVFNFKIDSVKSYLQWNNYLNKRLESIINILNANNTKVPESVLQIIKANAIYNIEFSRAEAFMALSSHREKLKELTSVDCAVICDSTLNGRWAQWLRECGDCSVPTWYFYQYNRIQIWKKYNFDVESDSSMNTDSKRRMVYYNTLKENYRGLLRERLLQYVVADETIKELGLTDPVTDTILRDYYTQPGFPEYKQWMKDYVDGVRQKKSIAKKPD